MLSRNSGGGGVRIGARCGASVRRTAMAAASSWDGDGSGSIVGGREAHNVVEGGEHVHVQTNVYMFQSIHCLPCSCPGRGGASGSTWAKTLRGKRHRGLPPLAPVTNPLHLFTGTRPPYHSQCVGRAVLHDGDPRPGSHRLAVTHQRDAETPQPSAPSPGCTAEAPGIRRPQRLNAPHRS